MVPGVIPEPFRKPITAFHKEDYFSVLPFEKRPIQLLGDASHGEWVGFKWEVANGRKDDVGMLAWGPREVPTFQRHNNCVLGEELYGGERLGWVALGTECTVVPDNTNKSNEAVEAPYKQGGPDV